MTSKCSCCGKEFPLEELSFSPDAELHIRSVAAGKPAIKVSSEKMHQLFCQNCLRELRKV